VQAVRAMGMDLVIAVDVGESGVQPTARPDGVGAMVDRIISLPIYQNTIRSRALADIVIQPDLAGFTAADFDRGVEMIPLGYRAVMAHAEELRRLVGTARHTPDAANHHRERPDGTKVVSIDRIEIVGQGGVDPRRIQSLMRTRPGELDTAILDQDIKRIYALGLFESVGYSVEQRDEDHTRTLRIATRPKAWGPTYVHLGLDLATDMQGLSAFGAVASFQATELNRLGADWKTTVRLGSPLELRTRFYEPLGYGGGFFVSPRLAWVQSRRDVFQSSVAVGTYRVQSGLAGMDLGMNLGAVGRISLGYERGYGGGRRSVGDPAFPNVDFQTGAVVADLAIDQLDDASLPRAGHLLEIHYIGERVGLGATSSYDRIEARAGVVTTRGRWSTGLVLAGGGGAAGDIPFYDEFQLGGLFRLSGRPRGQLTGDHYLLGTVLVYRRMTKVAGSLRKHVYVGASVEGGQAAAARDDLAPAKMKRSGSLFVVGDTFFGPLLLAYGHASGNDSLYLFLNRPF